MNGMSPRWLAKNVARSVTVPSGGPADSARRAFRDGDAELHELTVDPRNAPEGVILRGQAPNHMNAQGPLAALSRGAMGGNPPSSRSVTYITRTCPEAEWAYTEALANCPKCWHSAIRHAHVTRYERRAANFTGFLHHACAIILLRDL
jgi:hypothetical protein